MGHLIGEGVNWRVRLIGVGMLIKKMRATCYLSILATWIHIINRVVICKIHKNEQIFLNNLLILGTRDSGLDRALFEFEF